MRRFVLTCVLVLPACGTLLSIDDNSTSSSRPAATSDASSTDDHEENAPQDAGLGADASELMLADFGGMFGQADGAALSNPVTGDRTCPSGYDLHIVFGTAGMDYPIILCTRPHVEGRSAVADFGGMFGF